MEINTAKTTINPKFTKAVSKLKQHNNEKNYKALIDTIKDSRLIVPVVFSPEPEFDANDEMIYTEDMKFAFICIENTDNQKFLPVFTSMTELRKWLPEHKCNVVLSFDECCDNLRENGEVCGIAFDPYGCNFPLTRKDSLRLCEVFYGKKDYSESSSEK